jgi:hypothetical protein
VTAFGASLGTWTAVDLWFNTSGDPKAVDVFVGNEKVGRLSGPDAALLDPVFAAAQQFQELPRLRGTLQWLDPPLDGAGLVG